jgi:Leucine-rich repeat (LRR) protein
MNLFYQNTFRITIFLSFFWAGAFSEKAHCQLLDSAALFSAPVYDNLEEAMQHANSVYRLSLHGKKLKTFPLEILNFKNLQELDLSKNRIDSLPDQIAVLQNLQVLDISSNKLEYLPDSIGKLKNLKKIAAGKNELLAIPKQIGELENLEILDLWSNQIGIFPEELGKLKKLRWMDLRVIQIEDDLQKHIQDILPNVIIHFSPSCHCVSG